MNVASAFNAALASSSIGSSFPSKRLGHAQPAGAPLPKNAAPTPPSSGNGAAPEHNGVRAAPTLPSWFRARVARDVRTVSCGVDADDVLQEMRLVMLQRGWPGACGVRLNWLFLEVLRRFRRPPTDELTELAAHYSEDIENLIDLESAASRLAPAEATALLGSASGAPLRTIAGDLGVSIATAHRLVAAARTRLLAA